MSTKASSKTLTIAALSLKINASGLGGANVDTATATEFDVEVEYEYSPGWEDKRMGGAMEDGEPGVDSECSISAIKATANVHFSGDMCDTLVRRGSDMLALFTGREVDELCERIIDEIEKGGEL